MSSPSLPSTDVSPHPTRTADPHEKKQYHESKLEEVELEGDGRPPFVLTMTEWKLLGIAGVRHLSQPITGHTTLNLYLFPSGRFLLGW
jgi:hypothetical protein